MTATGRKRCVVVYATRERCLQWTVELAETATIGDALAVARASASNEEVPWDHSAVGIFGELCDRGAIPVDGDRIEIYRPLANDPRERRRQRVRQLRGSSRGGSSDV